MQSPGQTHSESVTTSAAEHLLEPEPHPGERDPEPREENKSSGPADTETPNTPEKSQPGLQTAGSTAGMAITQAVEIKSGVKSQTKSWENTATVGKDSAAKPSAPAEAANNVGANSGCDGKKAKKQGKGVGEGRRYVLSKKAMVDPLKMDMSKPLVMPLTSSELSLQCIECHIIFSDSKSKERHLKLSHPAEYEQCILRNALFACYVCDRHFTNSTELMVHQKAHTEKTPFKCPICSMAFKKSSELTAHKKIHFGQDGYACVECGKPCKTLTLLKYHQRTHTGERPYVCRECGKRFTMSKALQKHLMSHLPEGAEGEGGDATEKTKRKKNNGASTVKYPCTLCKATFKSCKTRLRHLKNKHNVVPAAAGNAHLAGLQGKQSGPIITPISISQTSLLQVEPNGPLQKVDADIDTEQIRRLIESLGNVQKVNQVVILGQVPHDAPPLEVQQVSHPAVPMNVNLGPPQIDFIGLKDAQFKTNELDPHGNPCDPMEQTIILEPITPDGQLENPSFSELGSYVTVDGNIELTLVAAGPTDPPEGEVAHTILQQPEIGAIHYDTVISQNDTDNLNQDLEQTVILELTPALTLTAELEQSQTEPQSEIPSSSLLLNTNQEIPEQNADQTVTDEQETDLLVPPLTPTVTLELTSIIPEQPDLSSCPLAPPETITQAPGESETNSKEDESDMKTVGLEQGHDINEKTQEQAEKEVSEKLLIEDENPTPEVAEQSAKGDAASQIKTQEGPESTDLPVNVMSAQELVKVRKRKPARTFIFQGYMQDLVGSIYNDDLYFDAKPAKRQRAKKSHLVVKFDPQSKDKKQKKTPQQRQPVEEDLMTSKTPAKKLSGKKALSKTKGGKGKKDKTVGEMSPGTDITDPSTQTSQGKQMKEDASKNKMKKQKVSKQNVSRLSEHKAGTSPMFKRKKQAKILRKNQPKTAKDGKAKKNLADKEKVKNADVPGSNVTEDPLLLLKGHKQPQLKVYKLDPTKASSQTPEVSSESQTASGQGTSESTDDVPARGKKKGGRAKKSQKALSLLSSLQVSRPPPETQPTKPKTTRKRKASSKVETEGVITSKRSLACKDCGEKFTDVSSLQKHKTDEHIIESPSLTYTNGNIFEGVSRLEFYELPKEHHKVVGGKNAATGWDTEPEMGETTSEEREQSVSFPALIPSPSLPVPPDVELIAYENKGGSKTSEDDQSRSSSEVPPTSDELKSSENQPHFSAESSFLSPDQSNIAETQEDKREEKSKKNHSSEPEVQSATDEDVKEGLILEVDLVTVGEQNERQDTVLPRDAVPQNESNGGGSSERRTGDEQPEQVSNDSNEKSLTSQTVSCSTHHIEVKEEEEEVSVQKKKEVGRGVVIRKATRGKRRGTGCLKRGLISKKSLLGDALRGAESENEQDECRVVYEKHPSPDSEMVNHTVSTKTQTSPEFKAIKASPVASVPSIAPTSDESPEEPVVFELESLTTSVEEVMNEGGLQGEGEQDREADQSPGIILERFLTSRQRTTADKETSLMQMSPNERRGLDSIADNEVQVLRSQEIKSEDHSSDPLVVAATGQSRQSTSVQLQHHRDVRTVLVKEESRVLNDVQVTQGSKQMRWNVEPVGDEQTDVPLKDEEREVLLGAAASGERSTPGETEDESQPGHQRADCDSHEARSSTPEYQETIMRGLLPESGVDDFANSQAVSDSEWQNPSDLRDFLLQSSDEEDMSGFDLSDPQLATEAEVMAYFNKSQTSSAEKADQTSSNLPTSSNQLQASTDDTITKQPINYFSKYFNRDTWVEIATCTNKLTNMPNPINAQEVACFVGIHIGMGTLKFPSPRLYWEDLTKVPLISEAMPLTRFLELSRMLKLTSPSKDPAGSNVNSHNHGESSSHCNSVISQPNDEQCRPDKTHDLNSSQKQSDPLWKVQPLLYHFNAGCQSLRRQGDYAVDQYSLPLTAKTHINRPSLLCTALIGFGGLVLNVDLKLDLSDKEDAVEKMVPKGSMVFLCKQELSTPAMLERLLAAGVNGAGRVGGARGQIGDEFVSSDGKLMLRRSHCGFILSTAGNSQRSLPSLIDSFEKAQMSARLNRDLQNLYPIPLAASAPSCWPQAVLWYLTDLALVNSWLLYRQDHRAALAPLTLMAFRLEVCKALILSSGTETQDSVPSQPAAEKARATNESPSTPMAVEESPLPDAATRYDGSGHWPEQLGEGEGGRCRFGNCQRTSRVLCLKCCVFLCISRNHNCFLNFHSQDSLRKEH
ncbi:uncharacterized protein LOC133428117 isoform X2 [Cololabis saira]|uniref:uncharacterized protein LOC133428117 isoform X2 n=1 Tax=Cololabis saira TaxID=129043 RepID=UPI002AD4A237|nr:uncharacterized protein LOC133428117 isoform X2 [Cololabis saira]